MIECAIVNAVTMPSASKKAWRKVATACHLPPAVLEHRRQQQGTEKQYVIVPGPDMPDPGLEEFEKLPRQRRRMAFELPGIAVGAQDRRVGSALLVEPKQAAVLLIQIEQQCVADRQDPGNGRALGGKPQDRVGAIAVIVYQMLADRDRAKGAVGGDCQPGQGVSGDFLVLGLDLFPGDLAIAVGVEADRVIEIAQRDVPLPAQAVTREPQREIAVARFVRRCRRNPQRQHQYQRETSQRSAFTAPG